MAAAPLNHSDVSPRAPFQRMRLYGPSLVTLAVLLPFFAYYLREVKSAQGYLNDRAFRILDVMSRQFGSEIAGVSNTMDAATILPEQFALRQRDQVLSPRANWLVARGAPFPGAAKAEMQAYLDAYILDGTSTAAVAAATGDARAKQILKVEVCCQTATSALRLRLIDDRDVDVPAQGLLHVRIDTELDPDRMIGRALSAGQGNLFETVFVASRTGQVLAEMNSSKLNVRDVEAILANRRVRSVIEGGQKPGKEDTAPDNTDQAKLPREVWGSDQRFDVQVSGTNYVLFVAPAQFVLSDEAGKEMPIAFYGLTQKEAIDAQARRLPSLIVPVIFILLIAGMAFLWPALKLYTMSDRDRVKKSSVFAMWSAAMVAGALIGTLYFSYGFFVDMSERNDGRLLHLSGLIRKHFSHEIEGAIRTAQVILGNNAQAESMLGNRWPEDSYSLLTRCCWANFEKYPFFGHVMLFGPKPKGEVGLERSITDEPASQRQIIKLSATRIPTPLISLPLERFPFIGRLLDSQSARLGSSQFVIQSLVSPSTGEFLPSLVFNLHDPASSGSHVLATTQLPSLVHVLLPQGFGFAVVDSDGQVLFHSDPSRNLHENFLGETDHSDELKAVLRRNERKYLWLRYGGRQVRAYVRPLGCDGPEVNCIQDLNMGLIVFLGMDDQKDLLSSIGTNFLAYLLGLPLLIGACIFVGAGVKGAVWPSATLTSIRRRIWPRAEQKPFYLLKAWWGLACFSAAFLIAVTVRMLAAPTNSLPLMLPVALGVVFIICMIGVVALRRKPAWIGRLAHSRWVEHCGNRVPLSAAYTARIFAVGLSVAGILSLIVFQLAVSSAEIRIKSYHYRALTAAMQNRKNRYLADFNKYFEDPGKDTRPYWNWLCRDRINTAYDLYDGLAIEQPGLRNLLSLAPILSQFGFLDDQRGIVSPSEFRPAVDAALARKAGLEIEPIWNSLPLPSPDHVLRFYFPGLLLLIAMFLWTHRIVRRLFILDFREPSPLPGMNEDACFARIERAVQDPAARPLDRLLIFAHPRSGTGVALERIVKRIKAGQEPPADVSIIDFGKIGSENATCSRIALLDNFEVRLTDTKERLKRLKLLEGLVYAHKPSVYVFTSIDPLLLLESLAHSGSHSDELQSELNRWTRLLGNFERFVFQDESLGNTLATRVDAVRSRCHEIRLAGEAIEEYCDTLQAELNPTLFLRACSARVDLGKLDLSSGRHFEESLVVQVRNLADGYYRVIWLNCTSDERLALYQLAKDEWLNPLNKVAISHLLQKQLIHRDGAYRLMNVSFRRFVLEAVTTHELAIWEKQQNLSLWPALRMALALALFLVVLFVSYFWRDIFDVYLSYFVALAGGLAALVRIVAQFFVKDGDKLAILTGGGDTKGGAQAA